MCVAFGSFLFYMYSIVVNMCVCVCVYACIRVYMRFGLGGRWMDGGGG